MRGVLEVLGVILGALGITALFIVSAVYTYAGYCGVGHHFGPFWAFVAIYLAFVFKITTPIAIGAFFCMTNVWHWDWTLAVPLAVLFAAPGLIFTIPCTIMTMIASAKARLRDCDKFVKL